MAVFWTD